MGLPILLGAGVGVGMVAIALGWSVRTRPALPTRLPPTQWRPMMTALAGGGAAALVTGWPALGLLTALGMIAVPRALSGARRRAATDRSEAVARWVEMLRDTMAGAAGLEEAVGVTARRPPPALHDAVQRLAARLHHQSLPVALRAFAQDVDDPTADLLVTALVTAATNETRDLGRLLGALADATHAQVQMRRSVDAGRAHVRSAMRLVLAITLAFVTALFVFSREYLAPYATVEGQLWLTIVGVAFFAAIAMLVRLDRVDLPGQRAGRTAADRGGRTTKSSGDAAGAPVAGAAAVRAPARCGAAP